MNPDNPVVELVKEEGGKVQQLKLREKSFATTKKLDWKLTRSVQCMHLSFTDDKTKKLDWKLTPQSSFVQCKQCILCI